MDKEKTREQKGGSDHSRRGAYSDFRFRDPCRYPAIYLIFTLNNISCQAEIIYKNQQASVFEYACLFSYHTFYNKKVLCITFFTTKVKNKGIIVLSVQQISTPEKVSKLYFFVVRMS